MLPKTSPPPRGSANTTAGLPMGDRAPPPPPGVGDASTIRVPAGVAELADAPDSKSGVPRDMWVRPPPPASALARNLQAGRHDPRPEAGLAGREASRDRPPPAAPSPTPTRLPAGKPASGRERPSPLRRPPVRSDSRPEWRNTQRRAGLKIRCPSGRVGSTPTSGIRRPSNPTSIEERCGSGS